MSVGSGNGYIKGSSGISFIRIDAGNILGEGDMAKEQCEEDQQSRFHVMLVFKE